MAVDVQAAVGSACLYKTHRLTRVDLVVTGHKCNRSEATSTGAGQKTFEETNSVEVVDVTMILSSSGIESFISSYTISQLFS